SATEFNNEPLSATPEHIQDGLNFVEGLKADGGTEIESGIHKAMDIAQPKNALRIVVFLTDGYIGNEPEILGLLNKSLKDARVYALGVGTSVNRFLLDEMARMGRGFVRYIDPTEDPNGVAEKLANSLEAPVLTNITIDWGTTGASQIFPAKIPDLFAGD